MLLQKLIKEIPKLEVHGSKSVEISGISSDSRMVAPGNLFVAKRGTALDGTRFISEALSAGAAAILSDLYDPSLRVTQLIHSDVRAIEGLLASRFWGDPSEKLKVIGVTGTKGKTTTTFLLRHILNTLGMRTGLLGTIEQSTGLRTYPSRLTTADVLTNQKLLGEMVQAGLSHAVVEVSSHALDQGRVAAVHFSAATYTNLSEDHLDYHETMEAYAKAKSRLFTGISAAVNRDCPYADLVTKGAKRRLYYSLQGAGDLNGTLISESARGSEMRFELEGREVTGFLPLVGRHNLQNALAAVATLLLFNIPLEKAVAALKTAPPVPGRLERVEGKRGVHLFVDFAHSGPSLEAALKALLPFKEKRLIVVFGAGGDRDPERRVGMARAAEAFADLAIVTSDNPRTEDPHKIIQEILKSFSSLEKVIVEPDRKEAIERAVELGEPGDLILVAGKGHEKVQIFANRTVEFDDCLVAQAALSRPFAEKF